MGKNKSVCFDKTQTSIFVPPYLARGGCNIFGTKTRCILQRTNLSLGHMGFSNDIFLATVRCKFDEPSLVLVEFPKVLEHNPIKRFHLLNAINKIRALNLHSKTAKVQITIYDLKPWKFGGQRLATANYIQHRPS